MNTRIKKLKHFAYGKHKSFLCGTLTGYYTRNVEEVECKRCLRFLAKLKGAENKFPTPNLVSSSLLQDYQAIIGNANV